MLIKNKFYAFSLIIVTFFVFCANGMEKITITDASLENQRVFKAIRDLRSILANAFNQKEIDGMVSSATIEPAFTRAFTPSNPSYIAPTTDQGLALIIDTKGGNIDTSSSWGPVRLLSQSKNVKQAKEFLLKHVTAELSGQGSDKETYKISDVGNVPLPKPAKIYSVPFPPKNQEIQDLLNKQSASWDKVAKSLSNTNLTESKKHR